MRTLLIAGLALLAACSSAPPFDAKAIAMEYAAFMGRDYPLRPGDKLKVVVEQLQRGQDDKGGGVQEVTVSPTGSIDLVQLQGPIQVAGRSTQAAKKLITEAYKSKFPDSPRVYVQVLQAADQSIYVCGEVFKAGAIPYRQGLTMMQAIATAGSFNYTVKHSDIRILRINPDGTQRTFRVNMQDILFAEYPDFLLLPGDVVYCQTSTVADLGNLVDLYIRRMIPFSFSGPSVGKTQ